MKSNIRQWSVLLFAAALSVGCRPQQGARAGNVQGPMPEGQLPPGMQPAREAPP